MRSLSSKIEERKAAGKGQPESNACTFALRSPQPKGKRELMRKTLRLSTFAVCLSILILQCAPLFASDTDERVLELVNVERVKAGVPPLVANERLAESAAKYALYLGKAAFFGHVGPDGSTLVTRNIKAGYRDPVWLGENIAAGFNSPESTVSGWMNSLPHRSNILDPNFAEVGIADIEVPGSPYGHYWVQEFGMRRGYLAKVGKSNDKAFRDAGNAPSLPLPDRKGIVSAGGLLGDPDKASETESGTPVITALNPACAGHGECVTIKGKGFGGSGTVRFGGLVATADSWSDTSITARVPKGAISSGLTVTNDAGVISLGVGFRVSSPIAEQTPPQKALKAAP
jgi:uncharacterized protein YkwD